MIDGIYAHEETSHLWGYRRDDDMRRWCRKRAIRFDEFPTNGIVRRLPERDDWARLRNQRMASPLTTKPDALLPLAIPIGDIPAKHDALFGDDVPGLTQTGGRRAGIQTLHSFLTERGSAYLFRLSAPGLSEIHCSRLSTHLTWGTLSAREIVKSVQARRVQLSAADGKIWKRNLSAFTSRLSWRCHFIQKLESEPEIEFRSFHPSMNNIRDKNIELSEDKNKLDAWKNGSTGIDYIDACMNFLRETGWLNFKGPPVVLNPKSESIMSADSVCPKVVLEEAVAFV